jgi:outer membrane cobalamin receptor
MDQKRLWSAVIATLTLAVAPAMAQQEAAPPVEEPGELVEEVIVVTASRTEQSLNEAPAAVSVLTAKDIESIPADNYGALLRNVPGLNVSQTSARDINMTSRGSTNTLSTSQLVLVDGRSLYLDFFGFVMWDFLPVNTAEIKQIEAVRGPGSAVWGANAMTGVVNLITKRPKEMVGTSLLFGGGELGTLYGSLSHAGVSDNFGYKVSAGYYEQDPYERPVIPGVQNFPNSGTAQPKGEVRLDWDLADDSVFSVGGGYAGTDGIIHTGIGPFDIKKGSDLTYGKLDWNKGAFRVGFFANFLQADSTNLVSVGTDGQPLGFAFNTDTDNIDASNTTVAGAHNIFTYGANYRDSKFDLEIAPDGTKKQEYGVFLQDEIARRQGALGLGGRYDDVDPIDGVFTRGPAAFAPNTHHTASPTTRRSAPRRRSTITSTLPSSSVAPLLLPARPRQRRPGRAPDGLRWRRFVRQRHHDDVRGLPQQDQGLDRLLYLAVLRTGQPAARPDSAAAAAFGGLLLPLPARHRPGDLPEPRSRRPHSVELQLPQHRRDHRPGRRAHLPAARRQQLVVVANASGGQADLQGHR